MSITRPYAIPVGIAVEISRTMGMFVRKSMEMGVSVDEISTVLKEHWLFEEISRGNLFLGKLSVDYWIRITGIDDKFNDADACVISDTVKSWHQWAGQICMLAAAHFNMPLKEILDRMPLRKLVEAYPAYHGVSEGYVFRDLYPSFEEFEGGVDGSC